MCEGAYIWAVEEVFEGDFSKGILLYKIWKNKGTTLHKYFSNEIFKIFYIRVTKYTARIL